MSSTALGMGAWGAYDTSALSRTRSRASSYVYPPRFGSSFNHPFVQQTVVVDGALNGPNAPPQDEAKLTRRRETIFGPDVGDDDQPGWVAPNDGNKVSVDTVKRWVEKAKSEKGLHATTTLQALVNLKRPTLLLQPLESHARPAEAPSVVPASPLHLLKFNYDAMTPQVRVTLTLHPTPTASSENLPAPEPKVLYDGTHPGGFNQAFTLPTFAAIDISPAIAPLPSPEAENKGNDQPDVKVEEDGTNVRAQSEDTTRSSYDRSNAAPATTDLAVIPELASATQEEPRRRFGLFGRRHREHDVEAQIEMQPTAPNGENPAVEGAEPKPEEKPEPEHGMRLLIRVEGMDAEGPLRRRNAQLTHILVSGTWSSDGGGDSSAPQSHGKRVWVVKVVRREAQIGAHSFLLKEIYGLSSSTNSNDTAGANSNDPYASTPNECIVCLTSPRDVVLLPCRHLVVCRDCAMGMVEFGAGGRVARREETEATEMTAAPDGADGADGANADPAAAAAPPAAPVPAPAAARRKKKAKGWYCPVCRQPYTSLLRLALPPSKPELPSRRGSIRSVRTTKSLAPTLPDGAEAMLEDLVPQLPDADVDDDDEDDHDHDHDHDHVHHERESSRRNSLSSRSMHSARSVPSFVVAEQAVNPPPAAVVPGSLPAQRAHAAAETDPTVIATRKPEGTV